jgi:antitoxin component YwqK of YwqJK toxin-antitoxin module
MDSKRRPENEYKDCKAEGLRAHWHDNGQKMAEGECKGGKRID